MVSAAPDRTAASTSTASGDTPHTTAAPDRTIDVDSTWGRRIGWIATIVAVCPIGLSAVHLALGGWTPYWDVAATTVRIRDVFSAHPPLVGMAALPSAKLPQTYSFPGAMHLYLLAVPVRLFGTTWGVLGGMAVLNTTFCVVAIRQVRRLLGERWGIAAALTVAVLLWTLGPTLIVYPTPMLIGAVPMFTFLVAAWAVATGDGPALVVLAFVGNYLFLDQLVFALIVPVVGAVALAAGLWSLRRDRVGEPHRWPTTRRSWLRWGSAAAILTIVVWIPPLVDQFATGGDNLGKLFHAATSGQVSGATVEVAPSLGGALGVVASVTAVPRAWLPPSLGSPPFQTDGGGTPFLVGLGWTVALAAVLAWGLVRARRRGDRRIGAAVIIGATGWVAFVATACINPDPFGYLQRYYLGLWALGAYLWLVAAVAVLAGRHRPTWWRPTLTRWAGPVLTVGTAAVVAASLAWPVSSRTLGTSTPPETARRLRDAVRQADLGSGPLIVKANLDAVGYTPVVMLGLQDRDIPFRVTGRFATEQYGASRNDAHTRDAEARLVISTAPSSRPGYRLVAQVSGPPMMSDRAYAAVDEKMRRWISSGAEPVLNPALSIPPDVRRRGDALLAGIARANRTRPEALLDAPDFVAIAANLQQGDSTPALAIPGVDAHELRGWAAERRRRANPELHLYLTPVD